MCPTVIGRNHTRVATLVGPAILGVILSLVTGRPDWIVLIGVLLMLGTALDTIVYPLILRYQPPWMTFVLALGEFGLLYILANALKLNLSHSEAIIFYWVCWIIAIWTKVVILPIASLTYLESSGEFRRAAWSIPPSQAALPILPTPAEANSGPGALVQGASGIHSVPLEPLPSPSGVHSIPAGPR